jgi:hypothetical protein
MSFLTIRAERGDGWEENLEGRERMDFIKTAQPQWMNLNISDTGRLDELFDHRGEEDSKFM